MKFLIDRCAGKLIAEWLRAQGHDVVESRELGPDPGDRVFLELAANQSRILITIDTDFGRLIFLESVAHSGLVRLPAFRRENVCRSSKISWFVFLDSWKRAVITLRGGRVRISRTIQ